MAYEVRVPCIELRKVEFENIYYFNTKEEAENFLEDIKESREVVLLPDASEDIEVVDAMNEECLVEEAYIEEVKKEEKVKFITIENNVVKSIEEISFELAIERLKKEYNGLEDPIGGLEEALENLTVTGYDHYGVPVTYQVIE